MSGEGAFANLTKGPVHSAIEVCVNDPANYYAKRQRLLEALEKLPTDQEQIPDFLFIIKQIAGVTEAAARYLEEHWFTWWSAEKKFQERILRLGIIRAIKAANSDPEKILPIDFLWLNIGKRSLHGNPSEWLYPYETYVMRSPQQVTCLLLTPLSPKPITSEYRAALEPGEDFWIVKEVAASDLEPGGEDVEEPHGYELHTTRPKVLSPSYELQSRAVRQRAEARRARRT
jgi:hypothetical protein